MTTVSAMGIKNWPTHGVPDGSNLQSWSKLYKWFTFYDMISRYFDPPILPIKVLLFCFAEWFQQNAQKILNACWSVVTSNYFDLSTLKSNQQITLFSMWRSNTIYWCINQTRFKTNQNQFRALTTIVKLRTNSNFVGQFSYINLHSKIKGHLKVLLHHWPSGYNQI